MLGRIRIRIQIKIKRIRNTGFANGSLDFITALLSLIRPILFNTMYSQVNKTALPMIHLVDVLKPGSIDYSLVKQGANLTREVRDMKMCILIMSILSRVKLSISKYYFQKTALEPEVYNLHITCQFTLVFHLYSKRT